ncbi:MAG: DUF3172 domain-containing protein [Elainellaceae cyanobacterium]
MSMRRRPPKAPPRSSRPSDGYDYSDRGYSDRDRGSSDRPERSSAGFSSVFNYATMAVLAAALIVGIGVGMFFGSTSSTSNMGSVATRYDIDRSAPDPELCVQYGASAIAVDMRAFLTLNPFNVYVSQPVMQPGCVIRSSNWSILQSRNVIDSKDVNQCRNRMNTFAYTGSIEANAQEARIDCVYQNDAAGNLFLNQIGNSGAPPETNRF